MASRVAASGRSTKKISSKRPLRISSGGSRSMSLAVATRNTLVRRSAIQVSSCRACAARHRCRRRPAPPLARPFSTSSIHSTQGCIRRPRAAPRAACARFRLGTCRTAHRNPCGTAAVASSTPPPWPPGSCRRPARPAAARRCGGGRPEAAPVEEGFAAQQQPALQRCHAGHLVHRRQVLLEHQQLGRTHHVALAGEHAAPGQRCRCARRRAWRAPSVAPRLQAGRPCAALANRVWRAHPPGRRRCAAAGPATRH